MPENLDVAQAILSVPLFSSLNKKQAESLVNSGRERSFKAGEKIVNEGDTGIGFYVILGGKVEVRKGGKLLATLGRGQYFGEMSLIDKEGRSADVVAVEATKCLLITVWVFGALVEKNPKIALGMLRELAARLRAAQKS
ncbi:MAG TPA: cyclic nucleotide-binding domain-containing protein [Nitrososphaerales archaeon]|nr:cyclic nucleotide-binding domain-containing protein [Nitrososphaerales archaeon]